MPDPKYQIDNQPSKENFRNCIISIIIDWQMFSLFSVIRTRTTESTYLPIMVIVFHLSENMFSKIIPRFRIQIGAGFHVEVIKAYLVCLSGRLHRLLLGLYSK